jgi:hypothetical protein
MGMGYNLHIKRPAPDEESHPISLPEWQAAVGETEGVRLATKPARITNPKTGEVISIPNNGGDTEVYFSADDTWQRLFSWSFAGTVCWRYTADFDRPDSEIRTVARRLARKLNAVIVGDEGEIYP